MKDRLLLFGLPLLLAGQGITVNDPSKNWMMNIPEPPIPRVSAGQSFISVFGHKVTRITDHRSDSKGGSWMHYYSDRSPLSRNSTYLSYLGPGGGTWIQPMNGSTPRGPAWSIYNEKERPVSIGQSIWSPADDETLFFIGDRTELWSINARTKKKKMIRDFTKETSGSPFEKGGFLRVQFASKDGRRVVMDYQRTFKEVYGILIYDLANNSARMYHADRIEASKKKPTSINPTFRLAGVSVEKEGAYLILQENGTAINVSSSNPLEAGSTYSYVSNWNDDPLKGPGQVRSIAGPHATDHGAVLSKGHARIAGTEVGYYINNTDWLFAMRRVDFTQKPASDASAYPYRDVFYWPYSTGTGAHVSAGMFSDDWLALSVYQETSCGARLNTPLSNEIVMLSSTAEATYDKSKHRIVKNGDLHRLTHHYSYPEDCQKPVSYWGQPHAAISMDGKYIVFTSTFGRTGRSDIFVLTLPPHLVPKL